MCKKCKFSAEILVLYVFCAIITVLLLKLYAEIRKAGKSERKK